MDSITNFLIVTPCLNAAEWIDETVLSVVSQAGDVSIRYHVQDGGSTDGTLEKVEEWDKRLRSGSFPIACREIDFSFDSGKDTSLYDAVNQAFSRIPFHDYTMMTYFNASDILYPRALHTVHEIIRLFPDIDWIGGPPSAIGPQGSIIWQEPAVAYPRKCLKAGLHDLRHLAYFVQQEGVFWKPRLWDMAGGKFDTSLKLAGDFDLWLRFAEHAQLYILAHPLAFHRHNVGRLSADLNDLYYPEVDRLKGGELVKERERVWDEYRDLYFKSELERIENGFGGPVIHWRWDTMEWYETVRIPEPALEWKSLWNSQYDAVLRARDKDLRKHEQDLLALERNLRQGLADVRSHISWHLGKAVWSKLKLLGTNFKK